MDAPTAEAVEELALLVQRDPERAVRASRELLARLAPRGAAGLRGRITWVLGRALMETGDLDASQAELRRSAAIARRAGDVRTHAAALTTLGAVLAEAGRSGAALGMLRRAEAGTAPADRGRLYAQRVLVHAHRGELTAAVAAADQALQLLAAHGDELGSLRLLVNRSIVWLNAGRPDDAERDLAAARPLAARLGQDLILAGVEHNLAVALGRRGDIPASLRQFEVAAAAYRRLGSPVRVTAFLAVDRAEVLLHAGLYAEAAEVAATAARLAAAAGQVISAAESELLRARALAEVGAPEAAPAARAAADGFRRAGRRPWVVLAEAVAWEVADVGSPRRHIARGRALAERLVAAGWLTEGSRLAALVAVRALQQGTPEPSIPELAGAERRRRRGPAWLRARWWYVEALRRLRAGDRRRALLAVEAGLRAVEDHRRAFGSIELRVGASHFGAPLAAVALDAVAPAGDGLVVLRWVERWRASSLRDRPAPTRHGRAAARALAVLRTRHAALAQLTPGEPAFRSARLAVGRAEQDVRRLARAAEGQRHDTRPLALDAAGSVIGDGTLVAYHEHRRRVAAVVVRRGGCSLVDLGDVDEVAAECDHLFSLAERAMVDDRAAGRARDAAVVAEAVVLRGIELAAGPTIVVPAGPLHRLPWGLLPSLSARALTVTPSVTAWLRLQRRRTPAAGRLLAVAGPGLSGADDEAQAVGRALPGGTVLASTASCVDAVLGATRAAGVLHVAAHGTFRPQNPMLSSLRLADGELTVYDLEQLRRLPPVVVLSACSAGRVVAADGAEVLGTVAVLLDRGVTNVVAPVTVVADLPAVGVMKRMYAAWAAGAGLAEALAVARRQALAAADDRALVVAGVLTCFGR